MTVAHDEFSRTAAVIAHLARMSQGEVQQDRCQRRA
jgi:hypothetical protein